MSTGPADRREQLHAPIRPVRGRRVALTVGVVQLALFTFIAIALPHDGPQPYGMVDRVGMLAVGLGVGWLLWRFGALSATPTESGLHVRNLMTARTLEWPQVVAVRFGGGDPWASLDLSDGETLAVMAIQRADGEAGQAQANRLATLVALHSRTARDD
jgi:hypothetical protein